MVRVRVRVRNVESWGLDLNTVFISFVWRGKIIDGPDSVYRWEEIYTTITQHTFQSYYPMYSQLLCENCDVLEQT